jgi:hypothetical protein
MSLISPRNVRVISSLSASGRVRGSVLVGSSPNRLADCFNQLIFVGERTRLELGIDLCAAHGKLETASSGGNHDETADGALVTG